MEVYTEITRKQEDLRDNSGLDVFKGLSSDVARRGIGRRGYMLDFDDSIVEDVFDWLEGNQMSFQLEEYDPDDLSDEAKDFFNRYRRI
jgi:hypothetical protein